MGSFQAKIATRNRNLQKLQTPLWLLFKPKEVGKGGEREKTKIVFPFPSERTGNRKFQKKRRKFKKIKK